MVWKISANNSGIDYFVEVEADTLEEAYKTAFSEFIGIQVKDKDKFRDVKISDLIEHDSRNY